MAGLPRVGGLYSPSVEAVLALRPDLVMLVPSAEQRGFRERLAELGVELLVLDPVSFDDVAESVVTVGQHLGREAAGRARAEALRSTRAAVERATRDRPRSRPDANVPARDGRHAAAGPPW